MQNPREETVFSLHSTRSSAVAAIADRTAYDVRTRYS